MPSMASCSGGYDAVSGNSQMMQSYTVPGVLFLILGIGVFSVFLSRAVKGNGPQWLKAIMFLAVFFFAAFFVTETLIESITPLMPDEALGDVYVLKIHSKEHYVTARMLQAESFTKILFLGSWA